MYFKTGSYNCVLNVKTACHSYDDVLHLFNEKGDLVIGLAWE